MFLIPLLRVLRLAAAVVALVRHLAAEDLVQVLSL